MKKKYYTAEVYNDSTDRYDERGPRFPSSEAASAYLNNEYGIDTFHHGHFRRFRIIKTTREIIDGSGADFFA